MVFIAYLLIGIGVSLMIYGAGVTHREERRGNTDIHIKVPLTAILALVLLAFAKAILY